MNALLSSCLSRLRLVRFEATETVVSPVLPTASPKGRYDSAERVRWAYNHYGPNMARQVLRQSRQR